MDRVYGTRTGFKVGCWILAVVCAALVVLLPATFLMLWIAYRAQVRMTDDKLYVRWIGSREISWNDISRLEWARGRGAIGALMRPLAYSLHSKPRSRGNLAVGTFHGTDEILAELTRRTGLTIGGV